MRLFSFLSVVSLSFFNGGYAEEVPASSKPAVILVPGAFHSPQAFEKVTSRLAQMDYQFIDAVALPSVGNLVGRQADTDAVKSALYKHLDAGRDVVLVGNSYGCTVIGEAVKGAPRYPPSKSGTTPDFSHQGRIISLIYLAGYIPTIQEVENPSSKPDIHGLSPIFKINDTTGKVTPDADLTNYAPQLAFYNLLPAAEADFWTAKLDFSSFDALNATATYIPYTGDFEVVYVVGSEDGAIPDALSRSWIEQPRAKFMLEHLDADHVAMLSRPGEVVELIDKYAARP